MLRIMSTVKGDAEITIKNFTFEEADGNGGWKVARLRGGSTCARFMRRWMALFRGKETRSFLAHGRQIKPPKFVCPEQVRSEALPTAPCAYIGAFQNREGRRIVVVASAVKREIEVSVADKLYKIAPLDALVIPY